MSTPKRRTIYTGVCVGCGVEFQSQRYDKKYHSHACFFKYGSPGRKKGQGFNRGSFMHRMALYLDENGLASEQELAQHLGVSVSYLRGRACTANACRDDIPVVERTYGLTRKGKDMLRGTEERTP